jgi:hypothetical protein
MPKNPREKGRHKWQDNIDIDFGLELRAFDTKFKSFQKKKLDGTE